jgi:hypothetical protein
MVFKWKKKRMVGGMNRLKPIIGIKAFRETDE